MIYKKSKHKTIKMNINKKIDKNKMKRVVKLKDKTKKLKV